MEHTAFSPGLIEKSEKQDESSKDYVRSTHNTFGMSNEREQTRPVDASNKYPKRQVKHWLQHFVLAVLAPQTTTDANSSMLLECSVRNNA